jgi:DNA-binding transcriptional LysR family regulator
LELDREWPFASASGTQQVTVRPRYSVNTADAVIAGAAAGLGIACVMCYQAADSVRDRILLPILTNWVPPPFPVQLVHAARQPQPLKLRAFLDFVAPRLQERLRAIGEHYSRADSHPGTSV